MWERAVRGKGSAAWRRGLAEHAAGCAACTVSWGLARAWVEERDGALPSPAPRRVAVWLLPVAAAAVLASAYLLREPSRDEPSPWRSAAALSPPLVVGEDGATVPPEAARLCWTAAADEARYDVRVTDVSLRRLAGVRDHAETCWTIPAAALAAVPEGSVLVWQVEARTPDGRRASSAAFTVRLGKRAQAP